MGRNLERFFSSFPEHCQMCPSYGENKWTLHVYIYTSVYVYYMGSNECISSCVHTHK